ncbi:MAG: endonuclease domain-containing protein [Dehalococcoidia bacterium]|nr:endonuclease domain-containing protein [Dehalococcoidia bacterium]
MKVRVLKTTSEQTGFARGLRQEQTEAESSLWAVLRRGQVNGLKFRRQHPLGRYIVDFVSLETRLVIEIDGGQHEMLTKTRDEQRTAWLERRGFRVIRFWNNEVLKNIEGVVEKIRETLDGSPSP